MLQKAQVEAHVKRTIHTCFTKLTEALCFICASKRLSNLLRFMSADKSLTFSGVVLHKAQLLEFVFQMHCHEVDHSQHENIVLQMCFNSIAIYAFNVPSSASWSVCFICASLIDLYRFDDVIRSCDLTCHVTFLEGNFVDKSITSYKFYWISLLYCYPCMHKEDIHIWENSKNHLDSSDKPVSNLCEYNCIKQVDIARDRLNFGLNVELTGW